MTTEKPDNSNSVWVTWRFKRFLPLTLALLFGFCCWLVVWLALAPALSHGYDISDEAFYLLSADPPRDGYTYLGFFGLYLHPIYAAVGYDVAVYRGVCALLVMVAGALAGFSAWQCLRARNRVPSSAMASLFAIAGMIAAANIYVYGRVTPGYDWVTLVGMLVALSGVFQLLPGPVRTIRLIVAAGLLSVGAFLAFVGRPPVGAVLWVVGLVLLVVFARMPWSSRGRTVAFSLGWLTVCVLFQFLFIVGPGRTIEILRQTAYFAIVGAPATGFVEMSSTQLSRSPGEVWAMAGFSMGAMFLPLLALVAVPERRKQVAAGLVFVAAVIVFVTCAARGGLVGGTPGGVDTQPYLWMALITVVGVALLCAWLVSFPREREVVRPPESARADVAHVWVVISLLVGSSLLFGISSNNGVIAMLALGGSVFLALAFIALLAVAANSWSQPGVGLVAGCILCTVAIAVTLTTAQNHPYRSASIPDSQTLAVVTWRGSTLLVSQHNAAVLDQLAAATTAAGFRPGTPLADFTPASFTPGFGYRIGSLTPSTLLMFPFTNETARKVLSEQDHFTWCAAWVITSPAGGIGLVEPSKVLSPLGLRLPRDYREVVSAQWEGYNGSRYGGSIDFTVWQPRPDAVDRCRVSPPRDS